MTFFNLTPISLNPDDFGLSANFVSEAWDINSRGDFIVGTAAEPPMNDLLGGTYVGFTYRFIPRFIMGLPFSEIKIDKQPSPDGAVATSAVGCNDLGDVVGFFRNGNGEFHGFLHLSGTAVKTLDPDDAVFNFHQVNILDNGLLAINNQRLAGGVYMDRNLAREVGFVADVSSGAIDRRKFLAIDMRQELSNNAIDGTRLNGINSKNEIVGTYRVGGLRQPFKCVVDTRANWRITNVESMGFIKPNQLKLDTSDLALHGINDNSEIVGNNNASNADAPAQTFVCDGAGNVNEVFNKSIAMPPKTFAGGISLHGTIVGSYRAATGASKPSRRAFFGFFGDNVKTVLPWLIFSGPFPPPTPLPFPPDPLLAVFTIFYAAGLQRYDGHDALIVLLVNEIIGALEDPSLRHRLRAEVLEVLLSEVRRLKENNAKQLICGA